MIEVHIIMKKDLKDDLIYVLKCLKTEGFLLEDLTQQEIAICSGLSVPTIKRQWKNIQNKYAEMIPLHSHTTNYGIKLLNSFIDDSNTHKNKIGSIYGWLMKYKFKVVNRVHKKTQLIQLGCDVVEVLRMYIQRKDNATTGVSLSTNLKFIRRLNSNSSSYKKDKLFKISTTYQVDVSSKKWNVQTLALEILEDAILFYLDYLEKKAKKPSLDVQVILYKMIPYKVNIMYHSDYDVRYHFKYGHLNKNNLNYLDINFTPNRPQIVKVTHKTMREFSFTSLLHIFNVCIGIDKNYYYISMHHTSKKSNPNLGREYNLLSQIPRAERKLFNLKGYDISSCMQSISLQLINATEEDYPLLYKYSTDKAFKREFREEISNDTKETIKWVKQTLTAFANGGTQHSKKHPKLEQFYNESVKMKDEVLSKTPKWLLELATKQSRKKPDELSDYAKTTAQASIYFFVWTYYEKIVRDAMMTLLTDGIALHDAVYSYKTINVSELEKVVKEKTGFTVEIENE